MDYSLYLRFEIAKNEEVEAECVVFREKLRWVQVGEEMLLDDCTTPANAPMKTW